MIIETGGYKLICDEADNGLIITSYEGAGAILNISEIMKYFILEYMTKSQDK